MIRVATWNINSVRIRMKIIEQMCENIKPDILCLQETKVANADFPIKKFRDLGYEYYVINGIPSYNGTAIFSKIPFLDSGFFHYCNKKDGRHCYATLENGLQVHNYYIPAGGDIPDPDENIKFRHKLDFLSEMQSKWEKDQSHQTDPILLVGDFNIAPLETDVWSHKQLMNVVSHTEIEIKNLKIWQDAASWIDALRCFVPPEEKLYSWWSYRARDYILSNRGRRLDHIWASPPLKNALKNAFVYSEPRGWEKPSDHVPVIVDIDKNYF